MGLLDRLRRSAARPAVPSGHEQHGTVAFASGSLTYVLARCECEWTERAMSQAAADGALADHLARARPWVRWDQDAFEREQAGRGAS